MRIRPSIDEGDRGRSGNGDRWAWEASRGSRACGHTLARQCVSHQRERRTRAQLGSRANWGSGPIGADRGRPRALRRTARSRSRLQGANPEGPGPTDRREGAARPSRARLLGPGRERRGAGHRRRPGIAPRRGAVGSRPSIPAQPSGPCGRAGGLASGTRRDGRAVEGARLESVCRATYRGFESHSLRHRTYVSGAFELETFVSRNNAAIPRGLRRSDRRDPTRDRGSEAQRTPQLGLICGGNSRGWMGSRNRTANV